MSKLFETEFVACSLVIMGFIVLGGVLGLLARLFV